MFEMRIPNQVALTRLKKVDTPKLSRILNGKRKPILSSWKLYIRNWK